VRLQCTVALDERGQPIAAGTGRGRRGRGTD
jgi:hypothetical protein